MPIFNFGLNIGKNSNPVPDTPNRIVKKDELEHINYLYKSKQREWLYARHADKGGFTWRDGSYLRKYLTEDENPGNQYDKRLLNTPLDNHVKRVKNIYRSHLFTNPPSRDYGGLKDNEKLKQFTKDVDRKGTNLNVFMQNITNYLVLYGNAVVVMDRPESNAVTVADENEQGIRAYANLYKPEDVLDWKYEEMPDGGRQLCYLKVWTKKGDDFHEFTIWDKNNIYKVYAKAENFVQHLYESPNQDSIPRQYGSYNFGEPVKDMQKTYPNDLGKVPAFMVTYGEENEELGNGMVTDIADIQRSIYNYFSNIEEGVRIGCIAYLAMSEDIEPPSGQTGNIISIPNDMSNPDHLPQVVQGDATAVDAALRIIELYKDSIDESAYITGSRANKAMASGYAMEIENQQFNSRMAELAVSIEEAEMKLTKLFFTWENLTFKDDDIKIYYERNFTARDSMAELEKFGMAKDIAKNPKLLKYIDKKVAACIIDDKDKETLAEICDEIEATPDEDYKKTDMEEDMGEENRAIQQNMIDPAKMQDESEDS